MVDFCDREDDGPDFQRNAIKLGVSGLATHKRSCSSVRWPVMVGLKSGKTHILDVAVMELGANRVHDEQV